MNCNSDKYEEIIYPIFLECCKYTSPFWSDIFTNLSYGKTPYGSYISQDCLCCSYKGKTFNYKIDQEKDASIVHKEITKLLSNNLGILSAKEKLEKDAKFDKFEKTMSEKADNWKEIKKKCIKDMLIEKYVIKMKKKYSLNKENTRKLISIIYIFTIFKIISSADIEYIKGEIKNIKGIKFDTNNIILSRKLSDIELTTLNNKSIITKNYISDYVEKYISLMEDI